LQTTRCVQRKPRDLADYACKTIAAQRVLHSGQNILVIPRFAKDHAFMVETDACERRGEEITAAQAPENRSAQARQDASREQGRETAVLSGRTRFDDFVEMPKGVPRREIVASTSATPKGSADLPARLCDSARSNQRRNSAIAMGGLAAAILGGSSTC
jgi:hypothetical protein